MTLRRYARTPIIGLNRHYGTSRVAQAIRQGMKNGSIRYSSATLKEGERLGTVAGRIYGREDYYWIIAAASGIGWALQVPPGTSLKIPNFSDIQKIIG